MATHVTAPRQSRGAVLLCAIQTPSHLGRCRELPYNGSRQRGHQARDCVADVQDAWEAGVRHLEDGGLYLEGIVAHIGWAVKDEAALVGKETP